MRFCPCCKGELIVWCIYHGEGLCVHKRNEKDAKCKNCGRLIHLLREECEHDFDTRCKNCKSFTLACECSMPFEIACLKCGELDD